MRPRARRSLSAAICSFALVAGAAACSLGDSGTEKDGAAAGGGGLTVAGPLPVENLDPHGASSMDAGTQLVARSIYSQLVYATGPNEYKGELATEWEPSPDARKWTLRLRQDVKFSDGNPVTADDVVASFERVLDEAGPLAGNFLDYTVAAPDDSTVVFTSKNPDAAFLGKISSFFVTPADGTDKSFFQDPVGSGPFAVASFEPGQEVRLKPNPEYWNGEPELDKLVFRSIPEVAARTTALKTGEVDLAWGLPDDQLEQLGSDSNLTVDSVQSPGVITMWMNGQTPAIKDADVRRALWQGVDFETIVSSLFPETGTPADAPISSTVHGYAPQTPVRYDPAAAKAALEKAGFDFDTTLELQYSQESYQQLAEAVASDLADIGVEVEPVMKEQAAYLDDLLGMKWDVNLQQLGTQGFDAATSLGRLYTCEAGRTGYCNKKLDGLLAKAEATLDAKERETYYAQASKIIWDDAVGMFPMFVKQPYAWQNRVKGFEMSVDGQPYFDKVTVSGD